jgi:hypothetical protein
VMKAVIYDKGCDTIQHQTAAKVPLTTWTIRSDSTFHRWLIARNVKSCCVV